MLLVLGHANAANAASGRKVIPMIVVCLESTMAEQGGCQHPTVVELNRTPESQPDWRELLG